MARMKDYLADLEDSVVRCIEAGAKTEDEIFALVYMYDQNANMEAIRWILDSLYDGHLDTVDEFEYN